MTESEIKRLEAKITNRTDLLKHIINLLEVELRDKNTLVRSLKIALKAIQDDEEI